MNADLYREALQAIPPDVSRDEWVKAGMAAHAAGLTEDEFLRWSEGADCYRERDARAVWSSFQGEGVSAGTLVHLAKAHGWEPPKQDFTAAAIWAAAHTATAGHPYIARKKGTPAGLRVLPLDHPLKIKGVAQAGALIVPALDPAGQLCTLQLIGQSKLNLAGHQFGDSMFIVGEPDPHASLFVCEGIGTAWACWRATGRAAAVTFGVGRFRRVARVLRSRYPNALIVLVPDRGVEDDVAKVGRELGIPMATLPPDLPVKTDAADYADAHGDDALDQLLSAHRTPTPDRTIESVPDSTDRYVASLKSADPHTHVANAHRIVRHFGDSLLYAQGIGWHTWRPPWKHDELGAIRIVQGLGRIVANEAAILAKSAANAADTDERKRLEDAVAARFKWARQSEQRDCLQASLAMAAPLLSCAAGDLDADPHLLGLPGGVLDLRTCRQRPHAQADRITKSAAVDFDRDARAPLFERFVGEIMGGDAELIEYLSRLIGMVLSGVRSEHILPIFWGAGANGKSTLLGLLQTLLGDYAGSAAPDLLIAKTGTEHPTALADLQGRRLVVCSESGEGGRLAEDRAKLLTGGDLITARRMREDFYTFKPTHLLVLQTNHRPRATGTDEGLWRRVRLVPFAHTIPADKRDTKLADKLAAELPGVLAWAVRGWQRYQASGLATPAAVRAATAEYRSDSDAVGQFLADCCAQDGSSSVGAGELYARYRDWCHEQGESPRTQRRFGGGLTERGFERFRAGGLHRWRGIRLIEVGAPCARSAPISGLTLTREKFSSVHTESRGTRGTSGTVLAESDL